MRRIGYVAAALAALLAASLAIPHRAWQTGEGPVPPLPLVDAGPPVVMSKRVWIDTDAACGVGATTDSDDCLALLLLARAPRLEIVGISTVAGNAALHATDRTTRALIAQLTRRPPVYRGAAGPFREVGAGANRAASALRRALAAGPLTIVALGPLTNVAGALAGRPDLAANVSRLVAVMGRRRGHLFHPAEGRGDGILLGHGPVFSDFNVAEDPAAAVAVFDMRVPTTLVPYEVARSISITASDLDRIAAAGGAPAWAASRSREWLAFWNDVVGVPGFYPFDLLAAAYVLAPEFFSCARVPTWVAPTPEPLGWFQGPVSVIVGRLRERPDSVRVAARSVYCPQVQASIHDWLVAQLGEQRNVESCLTPSSRPVQGSEETRTDASFGQKQVNAG